jgi:hypothetical protein
LHNSMRPDGIGQENLLVVGVDRFSEPMIITSANRTIPSLLLHTSGNEKPSFGQEKDHYSSQHVFWRRLRCGCRILYGGFELCPAKNERDF